ncbi:MAG: FAD-dependent oxidoreductase [Candidatus Omnitrophota bacterium]|nr:FAD-dependent oxidoreductase [Candidatus Omnitrophota bacterium]MDZ4242958.1 FAD-dependent oxidoreductase [Candidatus Omnitrophota bacterium]
MGKIVVLGQSPAAIKTIETLRASGRQDPVFLISSDSAWPYLRGMFPDFLAGDLTEKQLFSSSSGDLARLGIETVLNQKVTRINLKRKKIFFEDRESLDFENLVIADTEATKLPPVKGANKTGVFGCRLFKEIQDIVKAVPFIEAAAVPSGTFWGLKLSLAILKRKKEAMWIIPEDRIFPDWLPAEISAAFLDALERQGLRVISGTAISEVLGDSDAKAVRLKTGKVIAAEMVIFPDAGPDFRLFADTELAVNGQVTVDEQGRTNMSGIFAVDQAGCVGTSWGTGCDNSRDLLEGQGGNLALSISGQATQPEKTVPFVSLQAEGISLGLIGRVADGTAQIFEDKSGDVFRRIWVEGNRVVGCVLVNAAAEQKAWQEIIENGTGLSGLDPAFFKIAREAEMPAGHPEVPTEPALPASADDLGPATAGEG